MIFQKQLSAQQEQAKILLQKFLSGHDIYLRTSRHDDIAMRYSVAYARLRGVFTAEGGRRYPCSADSEIYGDLGQNLLLCYYVFDGNNPLEILSEGKVVADSRMIERWCREFRKSDNRTLSFSIESEASQKSISLIEDHIRNY